MNDKVVKEVLDVFWRVRLLFVAKSNNKKAMGNKLRVKGDNILNRVNKQFWKRKRLWIKCCDEWTKGVELKESGNILLAESNKLLSHGNELWAKAVLEIIGEVELNWSSDGCVVGDKYTFKNLKRRCD